MRVQDQVCTLEQAKKLKELGVSDRLSTYGYIEITCNGLGVRPHWQDNTHALIDANIVMYCGNGKDKWAAFNVAELGVMLPSETATQRTGSEDSEYANWEWADDGNKLGMGMFATEAEARADMLIYLLENGIVNAKQVNNRLSPTPTPTRI